MVVVAAHFSSPHMMAKRPKARASIQKAREGAGALESNGVDGVCVQPLVARQALGVYEARVRALLDEVVAEVRVVVLEGEVQAGVARVVLVVL